MKARNLLLPWAIAILLVVASSSCGGDNERELAVGPVDLSEFDQSQLLMMLDDDAYEKAYQIYAEEFFSAWVDCVRAQGFQASIPAFVTDVDERIVLDRDFVSQFGFGVMGMVGTDLGIPAPGVDPDEVYYQSLSDTELVALREAHIACEANANDTEGHLLPLQSPPSDELTSLLADAQARAEADPRYVESLRTWTECMIDKGHDAMTPTTIAATFETEETQALVTQWRNAVIEARNLDRPDPTVDEAFNATQLADIERLRDKEIRAALDDFDCRVDLVLDTRVLMAEFLNQPN